MFEGLAASLLEGILGQYVEGIDKKNLQVAVWSGQVVLENLVVKREACYGLGLPVHVKHGVCVHRTMSG